MVGNDHDKIVVEDKGDNNFVKIDKSVSVKSKLHIVIEGDDNNVVIGPKCSVFNYYIRLKGNGNIVNIGRRCRLNGLISAKGGGNNINIGRFCTLVGVRIETEYGQSVEIGEDCIFSLGVRIRTGDSHSIMSIESKQRINMPQSVKIGKHCWIGFDSKIAKGSILQDNTIVGACSYVSRKYEEGNCIVAGAPAAIVKRGTIWDRRSLPLEAKEGHVDNMINAYAWKNDFS